MSELGDTYKAMREMGQQKRADNKVTSLDLLKARGYEAQKLSDFHYRIGQFDFWPSTGKYLNRTTRSYGRGVFHLLAKLEQAPRGAGAMEEG